ncbi:hypothetical protein CHLRE_04g219550v5 [Chlamydomonas reinhardtii]|uniref:Uncharacterized protein n=1 Tax=Chlamydomonas reinhardtii TaxID=3055 RepID=A0A2K3DU48_CHLRE|nr:uncharacterized protein CHLRE_04g219550v5 [Chlamydomonas reinhardtii]PNW84057.1 hypothetical protein CHLRE_04g219550v5 [Chlamydomonas reinhardtii]
MPEGGPQELVGANEPRSRHVTLGPFLSLKSSSAPDVNYRFDCSPIYATSAGRDSVFAIDGRVVVQLTPASNADDSKLMVSRIAGGEDEAGGEVRDRDVPEGADEQRRDGSGAEARFTFGLRCPAPAGNGVLYVVDGDRIRKLQLAPQQVQQPGAGAEGEGAAAAGVGGAAVVVTTPQLAGWQPRAIWGLAHIPPEQLSGAGNASAAAGANAGGGGCLVFSTGTALYSLPLPPPPQGGGGSGAAATAAPAAAATGPQPLTPQLLAGHPDEPGARDAEAGCDARFTAIRIGLALDGDGTVILLDQHAQHAQHTAIRRVSLRDGGAVSTLGVMTEALTRPAVLAGSGCLAAIITAPQPGVSVIALGLPPPRGVLAAEAALGAGGAAAGGGGSEGSGGTPGKSRSRLAAEEEEVEGGVAGSSGGGHKRRRK